MAKNGNFISSFPVLILLMCFSSLIAMTVTCSTVLNRLVINRRNLVSLLILEVEENFSVFHNLVYRHFVSVLSQIKDILFY